MPAENPIVELTPASPETTGPLTELVQKASSINWEMTSEHIPRDLHLDVIAITLLIAIFIWFKRKGSGSKGADGHERKSGFLQFLFPRDIYTHPSARVDLWLWITERILHPALGIGLFVAIGPATEQAVIGGLETVFGSTPMFTPNIAWMLLYSLVTLLCYDFVFFLTHFTMHKVPALWAIHKVHHSAEVLTPLTRYREHFIAAPIWAAGGAFSYGFAAGIFAYLFNGDIVEATILNVSAFALLFGFNGAFRHYHVQFHYPRWLAKWLHSPVMHHVHHSYLEQHWDKNFAAVTSIWDRLFGCLYIPAKDEYTPWGISSNNEKENRTYWQNMIGPFRDWYRLLGRGNAEAGDGVKSQNGQDK
ncbi:MAG: sterol desaturase family protein [Halioglobus sp.]